MCFFPEQQGWNIILSSLKYYWIVVLFFRCDFERKEKWDLDEHARLCYEEWYCSTHEHLSHKSKNAHNDMVSLTLLRVSPSRNRASPEMSPPEIWTYSITERLALLRILDDELRTQLIMLGRTSQIAKTIGFLLPPKRLNCQNKLLVNYSNIEIWSNWGFRNIVKCQCVGYRYALYAPYMS